MRKRTSTSPAAPAEVVRILVHLGQNIQTARIRRGWRQIDLASRAGITRLQLIQVEKGKLTTAVGAYAAVLWALGLEDGLKSIADPASDAEGLTLEAARTNKRARPKAVLSDDF
jgi:transcriptional regulator with XRE-family HTH domain